MRSELKNGYNRLQRVLFMQASDDKGTSKKVEKINRCFFFFSETSVRGALKILLYSWSRKFENGCNARLMKKGCIKGFLSLIDY